MKRCLPALLTAAVLVSACSAGRASPGPSGTPQSTDVLQAQLARAVTTPADAAAAARAVNAFALDLHRRIGAKGGNLVFSPSSIAIALAMARAGARGETAAEMDRVLRNLG